MSNTTDIDWVHEKRLADERARIERAKMNNTTDIDALLRVRGDRYGDFGTHAQITQQLKSIMHGSPKWRILSEAQKESLEMIAHKIGRILNGDPTYKDSWTDIIGYAKLIEQELSD